MKRRNIDSNSIFMTIIILLFVGIIIGIYFTYEEVKLDTVIQVLGSIFGIAVASFLTGRYAIETFNKQVEHSKIEEAKKNEERQKKYDIFLNIQLKVILGEAKKLPFFMNLQTGQNIYNTDPMDEIESALSKMENTVSQLFNIDPSYISIQHYILLGDINDKIYEIGKSYNGYLATEEEEALNLSEGVKNEAELLQNIIEKRV